jgi:non-receptor tyrosine-protein kinase TYK2
MPLCQWKAMAKARKPSGVDAQPMASVGGLKVLLHWAGPDGGEPWVTFNEPSLTAEEICIRIAHKVGESRTSASW